MQCDAACIRTGLSWSPSGVLNVVCIWAQSLSRAPFTDSLELLFLYVCPRKHRSHALRNMASATVYLIGPPVLHPADIKDLLQAAIIGQLGREFRGFTIREMRGPVQFKSFWILESGVRHARRRPGLQSVDLWCVVCVWPPPSLDQSPRSVSYTIPRRREVTHP